MSELLSSDALEQQFGPLKLEVLQQDPAGRIICNRVAATGQVVELSKVVFRPEGLAAFPGVHQRILQGTSIGATFKAEAGLPFRRDIHASYRYDQGSLPRVFLKYFSSAEPPTVTDLTVLAGPDSVPYADILEVFSPDVERWELTGGDMGQAVTDRLEAFGAELDALGHPA
jgi:hypothetical protein